jgi:erythromycin esterase-like protein
MQTPETSETAQRPGPTADRAPAEAAVRAAARPLTGAAADYDALLELIGDARIVLLGEASHGTHEFYRARAEITRRLIAERGFVAVVAEADWPDAYRVNRFVRGQGEDATAEQALADFRRFPAWMWRNTDVLGFVGWLRAHNAALPSGRRTGFYGMDLYSLTASTEAVIAYLDRVDPEAARRARARYACFEAFEKDAQAYGYAAAHGMVETCEDEVVAQLVELQRRASEDAGYPLAGGDGRYAEDERFVAEQNARVARNAEAYYRTMFRGGRSSWNLRDRHMAETLAALVDHLDGRVGRSGAAKVAVWAHNSHLGDARATAAAGRGELNVGQLVRERWAAEAFLVGFSTYAGTVTAARDWDRPAERRRVRPAQPGSYEALLHATGVEAPGFLLALGDPGGRGQPEAVHRAREALSEARLERFIGVVYRPETERWSHYMRCALPRQFDALLHFDATQAVEPLERGPGWVAGEAPPAGESGEPPETFPSAL